ncbi:MAG: sigma-70 family RNA polymerase sigma factor [FCB group bacterium]|jgi:RNA polymerase sigma-70 factor (ECF subfamily)|nr:sigma-70 family RNA polymerase sigma factor [FCB group bacterium]
MFGTRENDEALIIRRVLSGEREAFGFLVKRHLPAVYAVAYARTHNHADAEDVAQEAFLSALQSLDRLRDPRKFVSWTVSITRRVAADTFRARARRLEGEPPEGGEDARPSVERAELFALVDRELAEIDDASREVLLLHYFAGRNGREIAHLLGISHGAVRKRLQRAREVLGARILSEVGDAKDVRAMLAQPVERISCAAIAVPVAWKVGVAGAAVGATGAGVAGLAKAAMTAAIVVAVGAAVWVQVARHHLPVSPVASATSSKVSGVPATPGAQPAVPTHAGQGEGVATSTGAATTPDASPQLTVTARKTTGESVKPNVYLCKGERSHPRPSELISINDHSQKTDPFVPIPPNWRGADEALFRGLAPGLYTLCVWEGEDGLVSVKGPVQVDIKEGGAPIALTVEVMEGGIVAGRVTDVATHLPLTGISVGASNHGGVEPGSRNATTDADGRYRITGLGKATYSISVGPMPSLGFLPIVGADELQAEAAPGKTVEGIDFSMRGTPSIRGRFLDKDGQPAAGVGVKADAPSGDKSPFQERTWSFSKTAVTKADGRFELKGVEPTDGLYVSLYDPAGKSAYCARPIGPLTLTEKGLEGLLIRAQEPAEISGVVADSEGKPVSAGTQVWVSSMKFRWGHSATTDARGAFILENVIDGELALSAYVRKEGSLGAPITETVEPVKVLASPGQKISEVKITVPAVPPSLSLSGTVRDAAGKAVEGVRVKAEPEKGYEYCVLVTDDDEGVLTDQDGRYRIDGLVSGPYRLVVKDESQRYRTTFRSPIPAGSVDADFTLQEAHFVEGQVVCADNGQAITDFQIMLWPQRREDKIDMAGSGDGHVSNDGGRFKLLLDFEGTKDVTLVARGPGYSTEQEIIATVSSDSGRTGVVLKLRRTGTVQGIVLDPDGRPKSEARIFLGEHVFMKETSYALLVKSRHDGTFELTELAPEPQKLTAFHPDHAPTSVDVSPKPDRPQTVEIRLKRGVALEGDLTIGGNPPDQYELMNVFVDYTPVWVPRSTELFPPSRFLGTGEFEGRGTAHYSLAHPLLPGHVWITARFPDPAYNLRLLQRETTLEEGIPARVDLDYPESTCVLEGTVSAPVGVDVFLMGIVVSAGEGKAFTRRHGSTGEYRFDELPEGAGEVSVLTRRPDGQDVVRTVPVTLVAGTPCRLDVDLR